MAVYTHNVSVNMQLYSTLDVPWTFAEGIYDEVKTARDAPILFEKSTTKLVSLRRMGLFPV